MGDTVVYMIIVLLGNPGKQYENTKHNAGWLVADEWNLDWQENKYAESLDASDGARTFVKPQTFMNESGRSVLWYVKKHSILADDVVVVYDDVDLPLGSVRVSFNRGSGGHNGIKSIEQALGNPAFVRIRIGVAHVDEEGRASVPGLRHDFVLSSFSSDDQKTIKALGDKVMKILDTISSDGHEKAMNEFN
jgi:PTH1 family peptidyl-tRNA hydrolase